MRASLRIDTASGRVLDRGALPSKYVTLDGTPVHYFHSGPTTLPDVPPTLEQGRLFLLVHAAGSNAGMWRRQLAGLAAGHSVVALDLPGHGRSRASTGSRRSTRTPTWSPLRRGASPSAVRPRRTEHGRWRSDSWSPPGTASDCGGSFWWTAARFPLKAEPIETWRDVVRGRPRSSSPPRCSRRHRHGSHARGFMEQVKTDPRVRYTDMLACNGFDFSARARRAALADAGGHRPRRPVRAAGQGRGAAARHRRRAPRGDRRGRAHADQRAAGGVQRALDEFAEALPR